MIYDKASFESTHHMNEICIPTAVHLRYLTRLLYLFNLKQFSNYVIIYASLTERKMRAVCQTKNVIDVNLNGRVM